MTPTQRLLAWPVLLIAFILGLAACWPTRLAPAPTVTPLAAATLPALPTAAPPRPTATATQPPTEPPAIPSPAPTPVPATSTPASLSLDPQAYSLARVAGGLQEPVFLTHAGDGSGRLFVVEQPGTIRILEAGAAADGGAAPFLDITERVRDTSNEQGLLGLAFHPDYAANGYFFVNYTDNNGDTVVARYTVSSDPDRADPDSERVVLQIAQPYPNHNGGALAFGPDGFLYIGMGDGGAGGDPQNNAQNPLSLLGKLLRIDVNTGADDAPYALPADNPFITRAEVRPEIWALGLRNPWRFSFDQLTGDLYIGDVGQNAIEEVDFQPAGSPGGENYGWRFYEGSRPYQDAGSAPAGVVPPIAEYTHAEGGCSVTGGYVYRGAALPALHGVYLFADYCTGRIWALARDAGGAWQRQPFSQAAFQVSAFGQDAAGELYLLSHRGGEVYQLVARP